jgi:hypothetical protein
MHDADDDQLAHIAVHRDMHDADDDVVDHLDHIAHDSKDLDAFHIARDAEDLDANHLAHIADNRDKHYSAQHLHRIVVHLGDMILHDAARQVYPLFFLHLVVVASFAYFL